MKTSHSSWYYTALFAKDKRFRPYNKMIVFLVWAPILKMRKFHSSVVIPDTKTNINTDIVITIIITITITITTTTAAMTSTFLTDEITNTNKNSNNSFVSHPRTHLSFYSTSYNSTNSWKLDQWNKYSAILFIFAFFLLWFFYSCSLSISAHATTTSLPYFSHSFFYLPFTPTSACSPPPFLSFPSTSHSSSPYSPSSTITPPVPLTPPTPLTLRTPFTTPFRPMILTHSIAGTRATD